MPAEIRQFLIGSDNFGVLLHDSATGATASIDAGEEAPILEALDKAGWRLTDILVTHHHGDHVAALPALKARFGARVVGPAADAHRVPEIDEGVREGDVVRVGHLEAEVIETPGHTSGHIAYHFRGEKLLFAGDTLFSLGCGRLLEGTAAQMLSSLNKLAALPDDTRVYCGHEYTLSNARFALSVDPGNPALKARAQEVEQLRAADAFTLPTMIGIEKATNPFLRAADPAIARQIGLSGRSPLEVFAELRERKNRA
ncbi:hydroxyacylglutathione hydrolase [Alsobacter sp. SYSU M60028]|uniref:Hydroxyacylglutathione hydrolase n=1 Tax=Alsobacter ponti TaxID=2962936 RepID=A0ABT1LCT1_9HYPH|nr:hydroxyacylglutathione hydrolase [Alsobacter ponti]MCP8938891.1 hydroxyacylglutathione hydrolase [Alsobacter ponti]